MGTMYVPRKTVCILPSHLEFLPSLDVLSKISGIPYLDNSDIDNNLPNPINSKILLFP